MSLLFVRAGKKDVDDVLALVESAYRGEPSRAGWTTEADLLDGQRTDRAAVSALIDGSRSRIVLARDEAGALVGSVLLEDEGDAAYVGMFAVRPGLQSGGVGSALLHEVERIARDELGRAVARMTVIAQRTELIAWYERRGYALTGEREAFPYGNPRFGVPRRDDLYFVVLKKTLVAG